jgi:hypothetical protein
VDEKEHAAYIEDQKYDPHAPEEGLICDGSPTRLGGRRMSRPLKGKRGASCFIRWGKLALEARTWHVNKQPQKRAGQRDTNDSSNS